MAELPYDDAMRNKDKNIDEDHIKYCIGNVTVDKTIRIYPNQKPWMTSHVHALLRARDPATEPSTALLAPT